MKLIIVGASGPTGRDVVEQALAQGHEVTAFARHVEPLADYRDRATLIAGDVHDLPLLTKAITGKDAVISVVGGYQRRGVTLYSATATNLIAAMQQAHVQRVISVTSAAVSDDGVRFVYRAIIKPLFFRSLYQDMLRHEEILAMSSLDWVIVRPGRLNDGPQTGHYRVGDGMKPTQGTAISRADLAEFLLKTASTTDYHRKKLVIVD